MKKAMLCGALIGSCEAFSALATPRSAPTTTVKMYATPPAHFSYGIRSQAPYGVGEDLAQPWAVPALLAGIRQTHVPPRSTNWWRVYTFEETYHGRHGTRR